jgi:hypothetical protein
VHAGSTDELHRTPPTPWQRFAPTRIVSAEGVRWKVYEVSGGYDRRTGRSLIFEHDQVWRRICNYPADWHRFSDPALVALLDET